MGKKEGLISFESARNQPRHKKSKTKQEKNSQPKVRKMKVRRIIWSDAEDASENTWKQKLSKITTNASQIIRETSWTVRRK